MQEFIQKLQDLIGIAHVLTDQQAMQPFLREWRGLFAGKAQAVVFPASTQEVSSIVKLCIAYAIPLIPQGGNTGLVGGQISELSNGVVLSLKRMNRVLDVDAQNNTLTVEAGATLHAVRAAAESADRLFPLSLASEGSCTIGGNIATNAGGTAVLAYGSMRASVLGLEVILPNGEILNIMSHLRKDNAGYDLKQLFIGSEGTLGIVTKAVLTLAPRPKAWAAAWCAVASPEAALILLKQMQNNFAQELTTFELMPKIGVEMVARHIPNAKTPLQNDSAWHVFIETSSSRSAAQITLMPELEQAITAAFDKNILQDAVLAHSEAQRVHFWHIRESFSEAQKHEGGSIKHDVSVAVAHIPAFIAEASAAVCALFEGARPVPFGHMGDGNIHFNISQPVISNTSDFLAQREAVNACVHALVRRYHGSIAAEHGVGRLKRALLAQTKYASAYALMQQLKQALDPQNTMNPHAVL
jgi:FAD/FMN-containing dehydrogenase